METLEPLLSAHPMFKDFTGSQLKLMVGCAANVIYNPGQFIFREGEEANTFYLVRHGHIALETFAPNQGSIGIQTASDGDVIGWSWLIPPFRWRFDARIIEQSRLIALDGKCLREKCEQDHDLGFRMMRIFTEIIAERLEATRLQLLDVYGK